MKEFTIRAIILGIFLSIIFGAANAYLGLKAGMTVSASIPAACVSMAILRGILKRGTILENNMVQTIASAGESLAAGIIFTIPALILIGLNPTIFYIFLTSLLGGLLGVLFMVTVRKRFIEEEDRELPFPEGRACAEVLKAGDEGGHKAKTVFEGLISGFTFRFLAIGFKLFPDYFLINLKNKLTLSFENSPALLGVGIILGKRISFLLLAGGLLGWLVFIPLIGNYVPDAKVLDTYSIWSKYIRYIGAGAVFSGGLISFLKILLNLIKERKFFSFKPGKKDLPLSFIVFSVLIIYFLISLLDIFNQNFFTSFLIIIFSFIFVVVSSRIVGLVGSSSNPVSGMTIATLFLVSLLIYILGGKGIYAMFTSLTIGAFICISAAIAGDISQDLKTGFLVGATPKLQQIGEIIGVITSSIFIGFTLFILHKAYVIGSERLSAPQATLMSLIVKGIFEAQFPIHLFISGITVSIFLEILGISSLPVAVGLYLPFSLSTTIALGGILSEIIKKKEKGILLASGYVAGDAISGILLALIIITGLSIISFNISNPIIGIFFLFIFLFYTFFRLK
ncbi:MAG: oligopeptide transporter, OPT family [Candidatus Hydrothermales bacterium]